MPRRLGFNFISRKIVSQEQNLFLSCLANFCSNVNLFFFFTGLILAGSADFKTELSQSDMFDPRLQAKVMNDKFVYFGHTLTF